MLHQTKMHQYSFTILMLLFFLFSGRKNLVLVILIENQRASILPSQKWVTLQKYTAHMVINLLKTLPGGKAIQMWKGSHQKYCLIMSGVSLNNHIYREPKGFDQQSKRGCSMSSMSKINKRSKLPYPSSKELKGIMRDQLVLKKLCKTARTRRIWESSFRETVSNRIVLSVDVGEQQIPKAKN